jgi:hypothetical protein
LDFFDRSCGGRGVVEDDKGLAFGFEVGLCDEVDDVAVFGEDFAEGGFEFVDLYLFFKVPDVDSTWKKMFSSENIARQRKRLTSRWEGLLLTYWRGLHGAGRPMLVVEPPETGK